MAEKDPLPSVSDKREVSASELENLAQIMREKVVEEVTKESRERQDDVERARAWYVR